MKRKDLTPVQYSASTDTADYNFSMLPSFGWYVRVKETNNSWIPSTTWITDLNAGWINSAAPFSGDHTFFGTLKEAIAFVDAHPFTGE
jgi:hypothetical protein